MITNIEINRPIDLFGIQTKIRLYDDYSESVLLTKKSSNFYIPSITSYSDIGFRIAYFLWIMRGSNQLDHLTFYKDHFKYYSDDDETLRGAYGPRLKYWVGADQIVEANRTNMDIDEEDDFVKPKGVDQLYSMYNDLKNGMGISTSCIFNPSLDYENSNDIPNLITITFTLKGSVVDLHAVFSESFINGQFVNDYFFLGILHKCMAEWLDGEVGELSTMIYNPLYQEGESPEIFAIDAIDSENERIMNGSINDFWRDLFELCAMERHMRMRITIPTFLNSDVSVTFLCEGLKKNFLDKIKSKYIKDMGYVLLIYSIMSKGGFVDESLMEFVKNLLENEIDEGSLLYEIVWWIDETIDRENIVTEFAKEVLNNV